MNYKGDLTGFPMEVVEMLLLRQEEQGNRRDIKVFEKSIRANSMQGGITWSNTFEGYEFWSKIINNKDFSSFFKTSPREAKLQIWF